MYLNSWHMSDVGMKVISCSYTNCLDLIADNTVVYYVTLYFYVYSLP